MSVIAATNLVTGLICLGVIYAVLTGELEALLPSCGGNAAPIMWLVRAIFIAGSIIGMMGLRARFLEFALTFSG